MFPVFTIIDKKIYNAFLAIDILVPTLHEALGSFCTQKIKIVKKYVKRVNTLL